MATPPDFTTGQVLTAAQMNAIGLWLVKTQTIGTAVATVNVTSCFTSDYDNYCVLWSDVTASTSGNVFYLRMLTGTTPTTANCYGNTYYVVNGGAGALTNANYANGNYLEVGCADATSKNHGKCEVLGPALASYTRSSYMDADDNYLRWHSGIHRVSTAYNGFEFSIGAGTMTGGTICVYGYRK